MRTDWMQSDRTRAHWMREDRIQGDGMRAEWMQGDWRQRNRIQGDCLPAVWMSKTWMQGDRMQASRMQPLLLRSLPLHRTFCREAGCKYMQRVWMQTHATSLDANSCRETGRHDCC